MTFVSRTARIIGAMIYRFRIEPSSTGRTQFRPAFRWSISLLTKRSYIRRLYPPAANIWAFSGRLQSGSSTPSEFLGHLTQLGRVNPRHQTGIMRARDELTARLWRGLRLIGKQLQNIADQLLAACRASRVERAQAFIDFLGDDAHTSRMPYSASCVNAPTRKF